MILRADGTSTSTVKETKYDPRLVGALGML